MHDRIRHAHVHAIALAALAALAASCGPPAAGPGGDAPPVATGTITVDGEAHDLLRMGAAADAAGDEYVPGKRLVMSGYVDQPRIAVFLDFDDVQAGASSPAQPFAAPDVTVTYDGVDYRALTGTIDVVDGTLDEGSPLHVRVRDATLVSQCGDDEKRIEIDMTVPVSRSLTPTADDVPAAGSVIFTFAPPGGDPLRYVALVDGVIADGAWTLKSADRCEDDTLIWQIEASVPESVAPGVDVPIDQISFTLHQVDVSARQDVRVFTAVAGTLRTDDAVTSDAHGRAHMHISGLALADADDTIDAGDVELNAAVGVGVLDFQ